MIWFFVPAVAKLHSVMCFAVSSLSLCVCKYILGRAPSSVFWQWASQIRVCVVIFISGLNKRGSSMNQKLPGCVVFPQLHVFIAVLAMKPYMSLKGLNSFFFFFFSLQILIIEIYNIIKQVVKVTFSHHLLSANFKNRLQNLHIIWLRSFKEPVSLDGLEYYWPL